MVLPAETGFQVEYESLRAESAQAREAQQTILQWSFGAIALSYAAIAASYASETQAVDNFRLVIFGLGLPGLVISACLSWMGELFRMERAGYYLRGRERATWSEAIDVDSLSSKWVQRPEDAPLYWENFIAFGGGGFGRRKGLLGYLASYGVYSGTLLGTLWLFRLELGSHAFHAHDMVITCILTGWAVLLYLAFLTTTLWLMVSLKKLGKMYAGQETLAPEEPAT